MRPRLDDGPMVEDVYHVRILNRRQPVRRDERRPMLHLLLERILHRQLRPLSSAVAA